MKRILLCLLCALLLTGCGKETDPAVAAAQRYQPIVQAVGDGTAAGVDLTDAQIAQAVAELDAAGLTAVHVDAADTVTRTRVVWRDGAFCVGYADTYAITVLTYDGGVLTYVYDMPDNPPGTDHDGHIDTQETFTVG